VPARLIKGRIKKTGNRKEFCIKTQDKQMPEVKGKMTAPEVFVSETA
jgi:hypothetical protein